MNLLCDDTLANIVSYCDFVSAVRFARFTCRGFRNRMSVNHPVWQEIYRRHCFSPADDENVVCLIQTRRALLEKLLGMKNKKNSLSSLPHNCFHFFPMIPRRKNNTNTWLHDFPPVDFLVESFALTSPGCSGEMALLDHFYEDVVVYRDVMDHVVSNTHHLQKLFVAGEEDDDDYYHNDDEDEELHWQRYFQFPKPPDETLMEGSEELVFPGLNISSHRRNDEEDIDILSIVTGIDVKTILDGDLNIVGSMVGAGRILTHDRHPHPFTYSEFVTFFKKNNNGYSERRACRFPWSFHYVDTCPKHKRIFASFPSGEGPRQEDSEAGRSTIFAFPLLIEDGKKQQESDSAWKDHGPTPLFSVQCEHTVSALAIDPSGETLLVSTSERTMEIWNVDGPPNREQIVDLTAQLKDAFQRLMEEQQQQQQPEEVSANTSRRSLVLRRRSDRRLPGARRRSTAPPVNSAPVDSFAFPSYLPISACGFCTLQHSRLLGSSIALWRKTTTDHYEVVSLINLPLTSRRRPRVHYDGRRIVVFGQDHIGMILLVYHVTNNNEDLYFAQQCCHATNSGDSSGGVYNFTTNAVQFANRIRHAAMGGFDLSDAIYMTCNERFVVVNTKTGNLLDGITSSPCAEGLLVIDLRDEENTTTAAATTIGLQN